MNNTYDDVAHQLRCNWFSSVQEFADLNLQRHTWLDKTNSNPHWSYIEFVCSYPDENQLTDARLKGWLTNTEYDALSELMLSIEAYSAPEGDSYNNAAVLGDPAWLVVVQAARRIQNHLLAVVTDSDERTALRPLT